MPRDEGDGLPGWLALRLGGGLLLGALAFATVAFLLLGALWLGVAVLADDADEEEEQVVVLPDPPSTMCNEVDLSLSAKFGTDGPLNGVVTIGPSREATYCLLSVPVRVGMLDGLAQPVAVQVIDAPAAYEIVVGGRTAPDPGSGSAVFHWSNWCGTPLAAPLYITVDLSNGALDAPVAGSGVQGELAPAPPCHDSSAASTLTYLPGLDGRLIAESEGTCGETQVTGSPDLYAVSDDLVGPYAGGGIFLENLAGPACVLEHIEEARLDSGDGELEVDVDIRVDDWDYEVPLIGPDGGPWVRLSWRNWCGSAVTGPLRIVLVMGETSREFSFDVANSTDDEGMIITPPCEGGDDESAADIRILP